MAYGVKFRLDFEDHEGNGKRLDILKDGYTGEILPLVGGAEPVKIKWDGDDDFYSPIIGSTCTINLYETDDTNYDDFFNEPEREYKVEVYTAQAIRDEFKNNVQLDGGIVEAADCLNGSYYDTGTLLQSRVVNDGGIMEAVECVSAVLTETQDNYTLFWTGWLLSDQFKEVMASNPQPVQLTAIDGLGELDNFFVDNTFYTISFSALQFTPASIICKALENTGLDLDVLLNNDIDAITNVLTGSTANLYTTNIGGNVAIFYDDEYNFFNVKEFLENILKNINARVFQANGKYVVLNNSTYSEQAIIDYVKEYKDENEALPGGIGTMRQAYLKGDIEKLYFQRFNSSGTLQGDYYHEGLRTVRTDLQPLEQNLTREAERGYKAVRFDLDIPKRNFSIFDDVSFEFSSLTRRTIVSGSIVSNQIALTGDNSFKTTATNSGSTPTYIAYTQVFNAKGNTELKLKLNYYYDTNKTNQTTSFLNRFWCQLFYTTGGTTYYYDADNNSWTTTLKYFFFENSRINADEWIGQNINLPNIEGILNNTVDLSLRIYGPRNYLTNYQGVYIDNTEVVNGITLTAFNERLLTQDSTTNVIINDTEIDRSLVSFTLGYTDVYDSLDFFNTLLLPQQATAKQQLNDFRTIVTRYEGTLYNNESAPVTPMDKIRINFTNFSEGDSLILDGLEYSVKSNRYNIIAHKPNQDNPVAATESTKSETYKIE